MLFSPRIPESPLLDKRLREVPGYGPLSTQKQAPQKASVEWVGVRPAKGVQIHSLQVQVEYAEVTFQRRTTELQLGGPNHQGPEDEPKPHLQPPGRNLLLCKQNLET